MSLKPRNAREGEVTMEEEKRGFYLEEKIIWLTLTELQARLSGTPTKHVLAVWDKGKKKAGTWLWQYASYQKSASKKLII